MRSKAYGFQLYERRKEGGEIGVLRCRIEWLRSTSSSEVSSNSRISSLVNRNRSQVARTSAASVFSSAPRQNITTSSTILYPKLT